MGSRVSGQGTPALAPRGGNRTASALRAEAKKNGARRRRRLNLTSIRSELRVELSSVAGVDQHLLQDVGVLHVAGHDLLGFRATAVHAARGGALEVADAA